MLLTIRELNCALSASRGRPDLRWVVGEVKPLIDHMLADGKESVAFPNFKKAKFIKRLASGYEKRVIMSQYGRR